MEWAVEAKNLTKQYQDFTLDHVSFQIPAGSIVGFIGENGAGKTTTIKALMDLIHLDEGEVKFYGKPFHSSDAEMKEKIGVVFSESYFPDNLNVRQINHMMKNMYQNWEEETFLGYCKRFQLPEKKAMKEYSGGMKMKLSIAAAMSHRTEILLLDEACNFLDPVVRNEVLDLFLDFIQEENHTILLSSHITSDIEKVADYILLIHEGKILLFENKDTLIYEYAIVRCTEEQFAKLDKTSVVGARKNQFEIEALVTGRKELEGRHGDLVIDRVTIEDILLFFVKNRGQEVLKQEAG